PLLMSSPRFILLARFAFIPSHIKSKVVGDCRVPKTRYLPTILIATMIIGRTHNVLFIIAYFVFLVTRVLGPREEQNFIPAVYRQRRFFRLRETTSPRFG